MALARTFPAALAWRIVLLSGAIAAVALTATYWRNYWLALVLLLPAIFAALGLFHYVNDTNRRLARLFESIRYSDFAIRFSSAREKGATFAEVNRQFNEVLEAFRQTRAEKEANLLFLNTLVQNLSTGLLAFDAQSGVIISNQAAFQLLGVYRLHHLNDLPERHAPLAQFVRQLNAKGKILYQPEAGRQLAVQGVNLSLMGRAVRLLTLQNIHPELQHKELDAWRNLTRVLRHEIMNSVTPIISLVETAQDIVQHDLAETSATADLAEALEVVAARSRGLVNFVDAYRSFSALPAPRFEDFPAKKLFAQVVSLAAAECKAQGIKLETFILPEDLQLHADPAQLEMVLLNLIKNARESIEAVQQKGKGAGDEPAKEFRITLRAGADGKGRPFIEVEDSGPGIPPELLDEVFIPFFTTKTSGSGVGLSISKQILQLHGGDIRVSSQPGAGARFVLEF